MRDALFYLFGVASAFAPMFILWFRLMKFSDGQHEEIKYLIDENSHLAQELGLTRLRHQDFLDAMELLDQQHSTSPYRLN